MNGPSRRRDARFGHRPQTRPDKRPCVPMARTTPESSPAVRARQSPAGAALVASGIEAGDDEEVK